MTSAVTADVARRERGLRQLELAVNRKLDGLLHGDYQGVVPGAGMDAGGGRRYDVGDDVRRIDWNLSARSNETYVRETIAERELETWIVVDGTASLDFGTAQCQKRDLASTVAAVFGFLTARAGNRIGAVVFDGVRTDVVPPRTGRDAVLGLLHRLERRPPAAAGPGALSDALRRVQHLARRRGLVVVVSDPREDDLPPVGLLTVVDPETGDLHEVQTASRRFRSRYAEAALERRTATTAAVRASGAAYLEVSTDRDWMVDVVKFVVAKRRRR